MLGGVPFLLEGTFGSLLDSTFEAMSGFTTTGATLLSDVEAETPSILFWRSMSQWLGNRDRGPLRGRRASPGAGAARLLGDEVSGLAETRFARVSPTPPRHSWSSTWHLRSPGRLESFTALALLSPAFWGK